MSNSTLPPGWACFDRAILSPDKQYRYWLRRPISGKVPVVFCMLNPSTADADKDDPTIRRCMNFAKQWDGSDLVVVNLFALRSTDPAGLFAEGIVDPVGPDNDTMIEAAAQFAHGNGGLFVCAWGSAGKTRWQKKFVADRAEEVLGIVERCGCKPLQLRLSPITGQPWHPLYLPAVLRPQPFPQVNLKAA